MLSCFIFDIQCLFFPPDQRNELINPSNENDLLTEKVIKVDQMFKDVQMTREGALDSASLVNLSNLGKTKAQALKTNFLTFNPADFCEKVKTLIAGSVSTGFSNVNWITLGKAVMPFFRKTPVLRYMCGTFDKGEVTLKQSRRAAREKEKETDNAEKASRPTQVIHFSGQCL
ncbi:EP300-interacting inhibitor of differentiation 3 [Biomphalaria glabrata]|nr:EP300-interacting inhibitor of differentiation 3 [Biomphalaria glabrata]